MSGVIKHCRVGKSGPSRLAHNQEFAGWQEWVLSAIAVPPVALTLWRALADVAVLASGWVTGL